MISKRQKKRTDNTASEQLDELFETGTLSIPDFQAEADAVKLKIDIPVIAPILPPSKILHILRHINTWKVQLIDGQQLVFPLSMTHSEIVKLSN